MAIVTTQVVSVPDLGGREHKESNASMDHDKEKQQLSMEDENSDVFASTEYWKDFFEAAPRSSFPSYPTIQYQASAEYQVQKQPIVSIWASYEDQVALIQAAWALMLNRYENQDEIVFATTCRTSCLIPIKVAFSEDLTTLSLLSSVQRQMQISKKFEHSSLLPVSLIAGATYQPRTLVSVRQPLGESDESTSSKGFAVILECDILDASIACGLRYDATVLDHRQAQRLIKQFETVVQKLAVSGDESSLLVANVQAISAVDLQELQSWNQPLPSPIDFSIHEMIQRRTALHPHRLAINAWDGDLTYAALDRYSDNLAQILMAKGVRIGDMVPFCLEKSRLVIVTLLAIFKAGAICVPLPYERLSSRTKNIIEAVEARVIITAPEQLKSFDGLVEVPFAITHELVEASLEAKNIFPKVSSDDAAVVIFTSGSTGTPKGVVQEHGALATSFSAIVDRLGLSADSRVVQFAAHTFDISLCDYFTTLFAGGCVCVPSEDDRENDLAGFIQRYNVNTAKGTSSVFRMINPAEVPSLKVLTLGAEPVLQEDVATWADRVRLVESYGPTECAVFSVSTKKLSVSSQASNIGRGFSTWTWLVSPSNYNQLAPIGAVGEILLEGPVLAREYFKAEQLTSEAFIVNPQWSQASDGCSRRFYKTGDLARYNSDGTLTIIGRKDTQVKIRGQRVELGEVEHQIQKLLPASTSVISEIINPGSTADTALLVAFLHFQAPDSVSMLDGNPTHPYFDVTTEQKDLFSSSILDLKESLELALPPYMVPSTFVPLRELPLNASAKTDRKRLRELARALPPRDLFAYASTRQHEKLDERPLNEVEGILRALWSQVLKMAVESIHISDNFFHLSGDSLKAMNLASLARKRGFQLVVKDILSTPVLKDMACKMNKKALEKSSYHPFCLLSSSELKNQLLEQLGRDFPAGTIEDIYPCTPLQEGLMALSLKQTDSNVIQKTLPIHPDVDLSRFCKAWDDVSSATASLRTRFILSDASEIFQVVTKGPIQWIDQKTTLEKYLAEDRKYQMGLGDHTSRYAVITDGSQRYFVWTLHHAICDGKSIQLILENVEKAYQQVPIDHGGSFGSFVQHLRYAGKAEESASFWKDLLAGSRAATYPALPLPSYQSSARDEARLQTRVNNWSTSVFTQATFAKAAWALLISRYEGSSNVGFGTISNGRSVPVTEIETLAGPTFATVPIRTTFTDEQTIQDLLQSLQSQAISMIPYEHTGLREISSIGLDCSVACQFRTMLIIQDHGDNQAGVLLDYDRLQSHRTLTYPITIECTPMDDTMMVLLTFDSALVDSRQAHRLLYQFETILVQLQNEANKDMAITDLNFVSDHDLHELQTWNEISFQPRALTIHELVQDRAQHNPNHEAVCSWDGSLSYAELDDYSTRLAVYINNLLPSDGPLFVPTCLEKSRWAVVTMLAILKAGGACVPLPFAQPTTREQEVLVSTNSSLLLASPYHAASFVPLVENIVLITGAFIQRLPFISRAMPDHVHAATKLSNPAFIVHTSGSTGKPKGVVQEHSSLSPALQHLIQVSNLTTESRVFQFSAFTFDVSFSDVFATLIAGGCVCLPSEYDRLNDMAKAIEELRANYAYFTPTVARLLSPDSVPSLKGMELVGEAVSRDLVETWCSNLNLYNNYGPSECGILCIRTKSAVNIDSSPANIGSGFSVGVWIVLPENHNILAPIGVIGEMVLSGDVLARGYLNQPSVTAAAFVQNPAWAKFAKVDENARFYKTGDLARFEPDGSILFMGRKDSQVKIRGQRVELGEIEAQLSKHLPLGSHVMVDVVKPVDEKEPTVKLVAFYSFPEQDDDFDSAEEYVDLA